MRKLKTDLDTLAYTLENVPWETDHYLDLETGQVIMVDADTFGQVEDIYGQPYDPESEETFDLAEILEQRDLPEWQKQVLLEAHHIAAPPIELWPRVVARVPIPQDVEQGLLVLLTQGRRQSWRAQRLASPNWLIRWCANPRNRSRCLRSWTG